MSINGTFVKQPPCSHSSYWANQSQGRLTICHVGLAQSLHVNFSDLMMLLSLKVQLVRFHVFTQCRGITETHYSQMLSRVSVFFLFLLRFMIIKCKSITAFLLPFVNKGYSMLLFILKNCINLQLPRVIYFNSINGNKLLK